MKRIKMREHFGEFLGDGDLANKFRFSEIEPLFAMEEGFIFDFEGVRNMSDSFSNACFGNLIADHSQEAKEKLRFDHCTPVIKSAISSSIHLGLKRAAKLHS